MGKYVELINTDDLKDGEMKGISVTGHEILLARVGDRFYAADNRCPHLGGRLSQGTLTGTIATCPRHSSQFDISDGRVVRWLKGSGVLSIVGKALKAPRPLATYKVKSEDGKIMVEI